METSERYDRKPDTPRYRIGKDSGPTPKTA